ncbi:hypothetical protein PVAG01_08899 [Phlyctema vagabunda]|uniref:Uncharacterized protein n=1 Tax=Phlyctema vagabunda TaxID=108571 RepID=A0ABR4PAQ8_9HELO
MAQSGSPTTTYNVYRVFREQKKGPDHEAIALVPAQNERQTAGRFYHVTGSVGMGMDYEVKPGYFFGGTRSYKGSTLIFQMPSALLADFERIARARPPPHDPRALMEAHPDPPVRNCSHWVEEVLSDTRAFLEEKGLNV